MNIAVAISVLMLYFLPADAHAYIDPNTGGYVFQWLFPLFSAIAAFFMFFRTAAKNLFNRIFRKNRTDQKDPQEGSH